jgi:hypothetical protein
VEAKATAALHRANMRDFLLREHHLDASTPNRIRELAHLADEIAERAVPQQPTTGAARASSDTGRSGAALVRRDAVRR